MAREKKNKNSYFGNDHEGWGKAIVLFVGIIVVVAICVAVSRGSVAS